MRPHYYVTRWYCDVERYPDQWLTGIECVDYCMNRNFRDGTTWWVVLKVDRPLTPEVEEWIDMFLRNEDEWPDNWTEGDPKPPFHDDVEVFTSKREASAAADEASMSQFLGVR